MVFSFGPKGQIPETPVLSIVVGVTVCLYLLKFSFVQQNWMHLGILAAIFIATSSAVEAKVGRAAWLILLFAGASAPFSLLPYKALTVKTSFVGISSATLAMLGAYLVHFKSHPSEIVVCKIVSLKRIYLPSPLLVSLGLTLSALSTFNTFAETNLVAAVHFGFVGGFVISVIHNKISFSDLAFLYPQEQVEYDEAAVSPHPLIHYDRILQWNPDNKLVRDLALQELSKAHIPAAVKLTFKKLHSIQSENENLGAKSA